MFLLDSNIVIWQLRNRADVVALLRELVEEGPLYASALTRYEILQGARPHELPGTMELLDALETVDVDAEIADLGGAYSRSYRAQGRTLSPLDCMIAATAIAHDLTLVTQNVKDFPMPELRLYGRD